MTHDYTHDYVSPVTTNDHPGITVPVTSLAHLLLLLIGRLG